MPISFDELFDLGLGLISRDQAIERIEWKEIQKEIRARKAKLKEGISQEAYLHKIRQRYEWEHWLNPDALPRKIIICDVDFKDV